MDNGAFRAALGHFATGIAIVTTIVKPVTPVTPVTPRRADRQVFGLTVNSFSSVSLNPPLVLWCLDHNAALFELFSQVERFAISVLNENQSDLSVACARHAQHELTADHIEFTPSGAALNQTGAGQFDCTTHNRFEAGDHQILIGEVQAIQQRGGRPLIYYRSDYQMLADDK